MQFYEKLQLLRKQRGITQEKLAELVGVSRQAVAKWEVGKSTPDMGNLITLSELFRVTIDHLVRDYEDENCSYKPSDCGTYVDEAAVDFLLRAKKSSYAGHGAESEPCRPGSHDLQYAEAPFLYIDTYLGGEKFSGQEAIWQDDKPLWTMNYIGRILAEGFDGEFLKEVLSLVPKEYPYRGPFVHRNGDFSYHCIVEGEFAWFRGYEEIYLGDTRVYECRFHGGLVK